MNPYREPSPRVAHEDFDRMLGSHLVLWGCSDELCIHQALDRHEPAEARKLLRWLPWRVS